MSGGGRVSETEAHVVEARSHGRYFLRPPAGIARGILVGFHGYTENAEKHLVDLESIPDLAEWALVAVDALHAFYVSRSGTGRVARGWMTRDLRDEAIEDNVRYVRDILNAVRPRFGWKLPVALLGYSQGASMAWRAALLAGHEVEAAIGLAGDVPPESALLPPSSPFPRHALLARGMADEWYGPDKLESDRALLAARGVEVATLTFAGGHEWTDPFREATSRLLRGFA
jgi:predicted esterase